MLATVLPVLLATLPVFPALPSAAPPLLLLLLLSLLLLKPCSNTF